MPPKPAKPVHEKSDAQLPAGTVRVTGDCGSLSTRKPEAQQWKKEEAASGTGQLRDVKERESLPGHAPRQHTTADFFKASSMTEVNDSSERRAVSMLDGENNVGHESGRIRRMGQSSKGAEKEDELLRHNVATLDKNLPGGKTESLVRPPAKELAMAPGIAPMQYHIWGTRFLVYADDVAMDTPRPAEAVAQMEGEVQAFGQFLG
ncbi:hypothetical protein NDU88_001745 [Pleurodeles waltl]|uniref:Uncharacterized protein n=1 Tax=Pleurodeles waltl TaxID=8319 RepID=A0AAV7LIB2_PLEWA|nr:hypothetical protein NDU88_001745 [Pleurodeles waltl]